MQASPGPIAVTIKRLFVLLLIAPFQLQCLPEFADVAPVNLDLTSTDRHTQTPTVLQSANVTEAGFQHRYSTSDMLTTSELLAVMQVLRTGQQTIQLGVNGDAIG